MRGPLDSSGLVQMAGAECRLAVGARQLLLNQTVPRAGPAFGQCRLFRIAGIEDTLHGHLLALQGILGGLQADHGGWRN